MKHVILLLVLSLLPLSAMAQSGTTGGLSWSLSSGTLTISGTGAMLDYSLSTNYSPWYSSRSSITTVVIGEGITNVGNYAFYFCDKLTSVTIPVSVTTIGNNAFFSCRGLMAVTLGDDVTHIGHDAFNGCGLTSITIPDKVASLGGSAFSACRSLTAITIPERVTSIGDRAFFDCAELTSITVESGNPNYSSVDGILFNKDQTILYCYPGGKNADSYTVQAGVTLSTNALVGCTGLKAIEVASNHAAYSSVDGVLFNKDQTALIAYPGKSGTYTVPDGVKSIEDYAFYYSRLSSVTIANSVESIGVSAFSNATSLRSAIIGSSVTTIKSYAFYWCSLLTFVANRNPTPQGITTPNDVFDSVNIGRITLYVPASSVRAYNATAGWSNFKAIYALETGACGENLTWSFSGGTLTISGTGRMTDMNAGSNNLAIQYASEITSVVFEEGVTHIGDAAFSEYYSNIASVSIPSTVTSIGSNAFYGCRSLTSIIIPTSVTTIRKQAFAACYDLTDVTVGWAIPIAVPNDLFSGSLAKANATLHIPAGTKSKYETATGWDLFKVYVEDGEPTDVMGSGTTGPLAWSLSIDGTLTISGTGAMPDYPGVDFVPWYSLRSSITSVVIEEGVTHIGDWAFMEHYQGITSVSIPSSVTTIGDRAFSGCVSLTSVAIPAGVTVIGDHVFSFCSSLTSIAIPAGVTSIGDYAFSECSSLTSITIPAGVTAIGQAAFSTCVNLQTVTIPASVTTIGTLAFGKCNFTDFIVAWEDPAAVTVDAGAFTSSSRPTATLHVPAGTKSKYEAIAVWQAFGTIVEDGEVTEPEEEEPEVVEIPESEENGLEATAPEPTGNEGTINISFYLPVDGTFTCSFLLTLPQGFQLNMNATALVDELVADYQLAITQRAGGVWLFEISLKPASLRAATALSNLVHIAYTIVEPTAAGTYEAKLTDVEVQLSDGSVIRENEITVPIRLTTPTSVTPVNNDLYIHCYGSILTVNTPVAETVEIYALTGQLLYKAQKAAGEATYRIHDLPEGILIARGSSGWTRKIISLY